MKPTAKYANKPVSDEPRDTESWALTEAARRLIDASRSPANTEALQNALTLNQKLWTIFQVSISEEDCPLPKALRENLAALSLLVDRETTRRLADLDAGKLDTLIQINRSVASGLAQKAGALPAQAAAPQAPQPQPEPPKQPAGGGRMRLSV